MVSNEVKALTIRRWSVTWLILLSLGDPVSRRSARDGLRAN
jgi:hypothetical protein